MFKKNNACVLVPPCSVLLLARVMTVVGAGVEECVVRKRRSRITVPIMVEKKCKALILADPVDIFPTLGCLLSCTGGTWVGDGKLDGKSFSLISLSYPGTHRHYTGPLCPVFD